MSEVLFYSLELLINETQVSLDDLKKRVARVLDRHGLSVDDWKLTQTTSQLLKLFIRGTLEDVDACHYRLNDEFVGEYSCIRLRDEAGSEIRQQAYPILARIEQQLRAFINYAMIEVRGFDWWGSITPFLTEQGIRDGVQKVEERIKKASSAIHHPLELALFDDLIPIVTGSIQYWSSSKPLSAGDLQEILSDSSSLKELQEKLAEKTREISLWDEVFARYFDDVDKWEELAKTLTSFVIPVRNQVMHHRPMYLWQLRELQETEQVVDALLESAVTELSKEDRAKVRQVSEDWSRAWAHKLNELIRLIPTTVGDITGPFLKQQEEVSRALREQILGTAVQPLMEPLLEQWGRAARTWAQLQTFSTVYVGSTGNIRFHRPTCRYVKRILPENLIRFASRDEAVAKDYVPCGTCRPG